MQKNRWIFRSKKQRKNRPEFEAQKAVISWARKNAEKYPPLKFLAASLNGVKLTPVQYVMAKAAGMNAGFPDLELPASRRGYHGLYIEMKSDKGRLSKDQKEWQEYLKSEKYFYYVANSAEKAILVLRWYLAVTEF